MHRARGLIGSSETIRRKLRKFEESHVDQVILLKQTGKTEHQDIMDSLQIFADEVMPEFHTRGPKHQEWKRGVLSDDIRLEEVDTAPHTMFSTAAPTDREGMEAMLNIVNS